MPNDPSYDDYLMGEQEKAFRADEDECEHTFTRRTLFGLECPKCGKNGGWPDE